MLVSARAAIMRMRSGDAHSLRTAAYSLSDAALFLPLLLGVNGRRRLLAASSHAHASADSSTCRRTRTHCIRRGDPSVWHACPAQLIDGHTTAGAAVVRTMRLNNPPGRRIGATVGALEGPAGVSGALVELASVAPARVRRPSIARCRICTHVAGAEEDERREDEHSGRPK